MIDPSNGAEGSGVGKRIRKCVVPECDSKWRNVSPDDGRVFFWIPKRNARRRRVWEDALNGLPLPTCGVICQNHFKASQVYRRKGGTLTLWKGEVPTVGLPTTLQVNDAIIKSGH